MNIKAVVCHIGAVYAPNVGFQVYCVVKRCSALSRISPYTGIIFIGFSRMCCERLPSTNLIFQTKVHRCIKVIHLWITKMMLIPTLAVDLIILFH